MLGELAAGEHVGLVGGEEDLSCPHLDLSSLLREVLRLRAEGDEASHTAIDWVDDLPLAAHMTLTSPSTAVLEWPSPPGQVPRTTTYRPAAGPGTDCAR